MKVQIHPKDDDAFMLIDEEDEALWREFPWRLDGSYVKRKKRTTHEDGSLKQVSVYFHREVMNCPADMQVDHIDGDRLNNQRSNLRIVTHHQNTMNQDAAGVTYFKGKWVAQITHNREYKYLGRFDTFEEARLAYVNKAKELRGEFARHEVSAGD